MGCEQPTDEEMKDCCHCCGCACKEEVCDECKGDKDDA